MKFPVSSFQFPVPWFSDSWFRQRFVMPTKVGKLTIVAITILVAIVVIALLLASRGSGVPPP